MDGRYHLAKLIAAGFAEPERIWREHDEYRNGLLAAFRPEPPPNENWLDVVARIHRKMQRSGLLAPQSGAVN
jgi:hypothetical protein